MAASPQIIQKLRAELNKSAQRLLSERVREALRKRAQSWLIGGVAALLLVNAFFIFIPLLKSFYKRTNEIVVLQNSIKTIEYEKKNQKKLVNISKETQSKLENAERVLAQGDISLYLETLSKMAEESGVRIKSIKPLEIQGVKAAALPAEQKKDSKYSSAFFGISAISGFHQFGSFAEKIENAPTFIKITRLAINANPESEKEHDISFEIQMLRESTLENNEKNA